MGRICLALVFALFFQYANATSLERFQSYLRTTQSARADFEQKVFDKHLVSFRRPRQVTGQANSYNALPFNQHGSIFYHAPAGQYRTRLDVKQLRHRSGMLTGSTPENGMRPNSASASASIEGG